MNPWLVAFGLAVAVASLYITVRGEQEAAKAHQACPDRTDYQAQFEADQERNRNEHRTV